jgi:hypothetical protein
VNSGYVRFRETGAVRIQWSGRAPADPVRRGEAEAMLKCEIPAVRGRCPGAAMSLTMPEGVSWV